MQPISRHISELLFDHDCVIVPSLGGFLASNENARLLPNRTIYPPYRRIAFNVYLKQNDGLLANHLVENENITYPVANSLIEEFTYECIQNLEQGKKVNIEEVGTLYFDHEKNIQFEAFRNINHRRDSFGLEPVHLVTVQREQPEEPKKVIQKPVKVIRPSVEAPRRPLISQKGKRYIGIAAALAAIVWFSTNLYLVAPKKYEATSLSPFDSQASVIPVEPSKDSENAVAPSDSRVGVALNESLNTVITDTETENTTEPFDSSAVSNNVPTPPETVTTIIHSTPPPVEVKPEPKPEVVSGPRNYIVAGVFKIKENAVAMVAKLQSAGFKNAKIIESNDRNYVSYDEYTTAEEAIALNDSLRRNNMEGWIWKH